MSGPGDIWNQAAAKWTELFGQIGEGDWEKATPCPDFTVRDLVDHVLQWQTMGGGTLGAETSPGQEWSDLHSAIGAALQVPANLEGNAEAYGNMPKQAVAGLITGDLLVHSWDLARALGGDDTLPVEAVEATLMGLGRLPEAMLRGDSMFGAPIDVADDASAQDKLLAFVGRQS